MVPPRVIKVTSAPVTRALVALCLTWMSKVFVAWPVEDSEYGNNGRLPENAWLALNVLSADRVSISIWEQRPKNTSFNGEPQA